MPLPPELQTALPSKNKKPPVITGTGIPTSQAPGLPAELQAALPSGSGSAPPPPTAPSGLPPELQTALPSGSGSAPPPPPPVSSGLPAELQTALPSGSGPAPPPVSSGQPFDFAATYGYDPTKPPPPPVDPPPALPDFTSDMNADFFNRAMAGDFDINSLDPSQFANPDAVDSLKRAVARKQAQRDEAIAQEERDRAAQEASDLAEFRAREAQREREAAERRRRVEAEARIDEQVADAQRVVTPTAAPVAGISNATQAAADTAQQFGLNDADVRNSQKDLLQTLIAQSEARGQAAANQLAVPEFTPSALETALERMFLGQVNADPNAPDAISEAQLAEFEAQTGRSRDQLTEQLNRFGILGSNTSAGSVADVLGNFEGQANRGRLDIGANQQARRQAEIAQALGFQTNQSGLRQRQGEFEFGANLDRLMAQQDVADRSLGRRLPLTAPTGDEQFQESIRQSDRAFGEGQRQFTANQQLAREQLTGNIRDPFGGPSTAPVQSLAARQLSQQDRQFLDSLGLSQDLALGSIDGQRTLAGQEGDRATRQFDERDPLSIAIAAREAGIQIPGLSDMIGDRLLGILGGARGGGGTTGGGGGGGGGVSTVGDDGTVTTTDPGTDLNNPFLEALMDRISVGGEEGALNDPVVQEYFGNQALRADQGITNDGNGVSVFDQRFRGDDPVPFEERLAAYDQLNRETGGSADDTLITPNVTGQPGRTVTEFDDLFSPGSQGELKRTDFTDREIAQMPEGPLKDILTGNQRDPDFDMQQLLPLVESGVMTMEELLQLVTDGAGRL